VSSVTRITQKKVDVADPKKTDQDSEKNIKKIDIQGNQNKKKLEASMKQAVGIEVRQQSRKSDRKVRRDQKTENE
jgi:predicted transcriptional regulator